MTTQKTQIAFETFRLANKIPTSAYYAIPVLADSLVEAGYAPLSTGSVPEWAQIELRGWTEEQQWASKRTLDGQGSSWEADVSSMAGAPLQFTMRLIMARGKLKPQRMAELAFWALRNYPEEYFRVMTDLINPRESVPPSDLYRQIGAAREYADALVKILQP